MKQGRVLYSNRSKTGWGIVRGKKRIPCRDPEKQGRTRLGYGLIQGG